MRKIFIIFFSLLICCITQAESRPATKVKVATVTETEWYDSIEALGTLKANEFVTLTAAVTDTISQINFEDGQRVEQGYILARMTGDEESAQVDEMLARVAEAKRQFDRLVNLPGKGVVSDSLYDQRQREYQAAKAQLEATQSRLKDRLIIAPFAGVVGLRNISVGALVSPGEEITTLSDDSRMKLDFTVPAIYLDTLTPGLNVVAKTTAYPEKEFMGKVTGVDSRVDPVTRSITVRVGIENSDHLLRPGLLMTVRLQHGDRKSLVIPEEAVIPVANRKYVYIVNKEGLVEKKEIVSGGRRRSSLEVISGLTAGEQVITHGAMKVNPGQKVSATEQSVSKDKK